MIEGEDQAMQLYKAQYIYPVSSPPIIEGVLAIDGERITAVGPAEEVMQKYPGAQVTDLGSVMLLPQAINAHTHLELTALATLGKEYVTERSFVQWIRNLVTTWRTIPAEVQVEGSREGCRMLIESGTAAVGDISNTHASLAPLLESGLYGVIYHEMLNPDPAEAPRVLQRAQEQVRQWRSEYGEERVRFGVTLHTPFTVSAELFRITLPWVIEELEDEEKRRHGRMRIVEVLVFIRELIQPICARMSLPVGTRHQIEQALETLWRLLEPPADRRTQFRFVYREPFNDALALLELYALSSGKYVDVFRQWSSFAQRVKRAEGEENPPARRKRRRRH